jgi:hypothetical protein
MEEEKLKDLKVVGSEVRVGRSSIGLKCYIIEETEWKRNEEDCSGRGLLGGSSKHIV